MDGEIIDVWKHVPHLFHPLDTEFGGLFLGEKRVKAEDPHLEGHRPLGDFLADAAEADDAERFVGKLRPHVRFAVPLAGEEAVVGGGDRRERARMRAKVCSAVLRVLPVGVFITTMPCRVAASLSMLSVPTPARAMARSRWFPASDSPVIVTPLRQMAPSNSASAA